MGYGRRDGYSTALYMQNLEGKWDFVAPTISFTTSLSISCKKVDKYIINEGATIIFWNDGSKTISKRDKRDKFDKELGFLFAYFYGKYKGSKASRKRVIDCIEYKNIKTFLFEFYVNHSGKTAEQAKKYLQNLEVAK